jgi:chromosome segregation ATPase
MSTITATDLIEEMTKIKQRNEELRRPQQDLIKEKKQLVEELGRANTVRTAAEAKAEQVAPLQQQVYELERALASTREELSGLRQRTEQAERKATASAAKAAEHRAEAEGAVREVAALQETVSSLLRGQAQLNERIAGLEPFAVAIAELKKVL